VPAGEQARPPTNASAPYALPPCTLSILAPVSLAPSVRRAFRQITAKEPRPPDHGGFGKFWDQGSDSECDDLGAVEEPARGGSPKPSSTILIAAPSPSIRREEIAYTMQHQAPRPATTPTLAVVRPPWMNMWKGPLPPRRITPPATIGDFIAPQLVRRGRERCSAGRDLHSAGWDRHGCVRGVRDPIMTEPEEAVVSGPDPTRLGLASEPYYTRGFCATPSHNSDAAATPASTNNTKPPEIRRPYRRINVSTLTDASPVLSYSYRDALMAGNRGHSRGGVVAGRGAPDHRRGWGRAFPPEAHNRDCDGGQSRGHADDARGQGREGAHARGHRDRGGAHLAAGHGRPLAGAGAVARGRGHQPRPGQGLADDKAHSGGVAGVIDGAINLDNVVDEVHDNKRKRKDTSIKLECTICADEHFTNQCPLLRGPKPSVAFCGAAEDGNGFFQIQAARNNHIVDNLQSTTAALVIVEKGEVSAQLLQAELARIIP